MVLSLGFAGWVAVNRNNVVVKISQPFFLYIIICGVSILASAIFPLGVDDSIASDAGCDVACATIPWLVSIGFSFIFAALFSKLWRINQVFAAVRTMKRVVIKEKDVLKPFASLMIANVVLLLAWTLMDPLQWERVQTDEWNSYGRCAASGKASIIFFSLLGVLNFIALILANVQAYMARSIRDELAESKFIGLTTLSMMQISIVAVPLLVIVNNNPSASFFVWTGAIFIICTSVLLLIFVPKVMRALDPKTDDGRKLKLQVMSGDVNRQDPSARPSARTANATNVLVSGVEQNYVDFNQLKALVLEEYHIDISSLVEKV